jgi:hypothetical protein
MLLFSFSMIFTLLELGCTGPQLMRRWLPFAMIAMATVVVVLYYCLQQFYTAFLGMYLFTVVVIFTWTWQLAMRSRASPEAEAIRLSLLRPLFQGSILAYVLCGGFAWVTDFLLCPVLSQYRLGHMVLHTTPLPLDSSLYSLLDSSLNSFPRPPLGSSLNSPFDSPLNYPLNSPFDSPLVFLISPLNSPLKVLHPLWHVGAGTGKQMIRNHKQNMLVVHLVHGSFDELDGPVPFVIATAHTGTWLSIQLLVLFRTLSSLLPVSTHRFLHTGRSAC